MRGKCDLVLIIIDDRDNTNTQYMIFQLEEASAEEPNYWLLSVAAHACLKDH